MGHVDADPLAAQFLGGVNRRAAAAEGVKHHVALVGRGGDDSFQQRQRLLRGVTQLLGRERLDVRRIERGIVPHVVDRLALWIGAAAAPDVIVIMRDEQLVERPVGGGIAQIIENGVVVADPVLRPRLEAADPAGPPHDLAPEMCRAEHAVQQQLQIMARGRITVEVQAAGRLQHAVKLQQPGRHHRQIGHHVVFAQERPHRVEQVERRRVAAVRDAVERVLRAVVPLPGILERLDLGIGAGGAGRGAEQHIVAGVRIERRVEVDQVDAAVRDVAAQDVQIVAVIKVVGGAVGAGARHRRNQARRRDRCMSLWVRYGAIGRRQVARIAAGTEAIARRGREGRARRHGHRHRRDFRLLPRLTSVCHLRTCLGPTTPRPPRLRPPTPAPAAWWAPRNKSGSIPFAYGKPSPSCRTCSGIHRAACHVVRASYPIACCTVDPGTSPG